MASLAHASMESAPREEQIAFWLNAYNAIVLKTVIDQYPIARRTQRISGDRASARSRAHSTGCRTGSPDGTLTLDQIEQTVLPKFHDPRLFLALGRGAIGSGRLRSEAYTAADLERQLTETPGNAPAAPPASQIDQSRNAMESAPCSPGGADEFAEPTATRRRPCSPAEARSNARFSPLSRHTSYRRA